MSDQPDSNWNSSGRVNASQRWRRPSGAMGRAVTDAIVAEARVAPGMKVLDVACGTGEPAISIAAMLAGKGRVVGADISCGPLEIARQRAAERNLRGLEFVPADVHNLPFAPETFDRVTSRLGVMFFADLPRALCEIHRVLKPSGRVSLLVWGVREQPYFETTIGTILRVCPEISVPASGAAMFKFGQPNALAGPLREAGFKHVEERFADIAWDWPDTPEELWAYFREVTIPFKSMLQAVPAGKREEVNAQVLSRLRERYDGSAVRFNAQMAIASASR